MRIVENALSISAAFLSFSFSLFFSLPPPHHVSPASILLFFERRGLLSSRLFQGDEISILFFFDFERTHTANNQKKCVSSRTPGNRFWNFVSSPTLPLSFIRLPPRTEEPKILYLTNE